MKKRETWYLTLRARAVRSSNIDDDPAATKMDLISISPSPVTVALARLLSLR